jgi:hypothetical protein
LGTIETLREAPVQGRRTQAVFGTYSGHPVDEVPPPARLGAFGVQHVLVMAASPISIVFLTS